jgi:hypothetical protein
MSALRTQVSHRGSPKSAREEDSAHRQSKTRLAAGCWRRPQPFASLLLLDAFDPNRAEAGVFGTDVCFNLLLFVFECLEKVDIGKL